MLSIAFQYFLLHVIIFLGDTAIVYFIFNSTLRKAVLEMFTGSLQRSGSLVRRAVGSTRTTSSYAAPRVEPAPQNLVAA